MAGSPVAVVIGGVNIDIGGRSFAPLFQRLVHFDDAAATGIGIREEGASLASLSLVRLKP